LCPGISLLEKLLVTEWTTEVRFPAPPLRELDLLWSPTTLLSKGTRCSLHLCKVTKPWRPLTIFIRAEECKELPPPQFSVATW
jgi:hypothetical protein